MTLWIANNNKYNLIIFYQELCIQIMIVISHNNCYFEVLNFIHLKIITIDEKFVGHWVNTPFASSTPFFSDETTGELSSFRYIFHFYVWMNSAVDLKKIFLLVVFLWNWKGINKEL